MSTPVTEGHRELARTIRLHLTLGQAYQVIADSEARATERTNAQVESLISSAKNAIPASEHPAEPTVENWAWQIRNLGDDRRLVYAERDQLRAERNNLRADLDAIKAIRNEETARAERAEVDADSTRERALTLANSLDEAQAELAKERARNAGLVPLLARWLKMADDCHHEQQEVGHSEYNVTAGLMCDTRAAIDAAMKEEAK